MKQYRITAQDHSHDHIPDAVMAEDELLAIRHLAGLGRGLLEDLSPITMTPTSADARDMPAMSPVGSNISITGMEKQRLEKQLHIVPGTPEWFQLWFSRPYLTGEKPVGDQRPKREPNPTYLLDKNGNADQDRVEQLATRLERKFRNSSN